jgi:hypothetical protein
MMQTLSPSGDAHGVSLLRVQSLHSEVERVSASLKAPRRSFVESILGLICHRESTQNVVGKGIREGLSV